MGDMNYSVRFHYTKGNLDALNRIAEDETVDEEDRELARKLAEQIDREQALMKPKLEGDER